MKESEPKVRNQEVSQLLDYGFSLYENVTLFKKGDVIEKVNIENAKEPYVEVICKEDVVYVKDKSSKEEVTYEMNYTNLLPPFQQGETIGHILLMRSDVNIASFEVTSSKDIAALTMPEKVYNYLKAFV